MNPLQSAALLLVALTGTALVFVREPLHQVMVSGFFGLVLTAFFMAFHAPDVALSQLAVGTVAMPLLLLLTLAKLKDPEEKPLP